VRLQYIFSDGNLELPGLPDTPRGYPISNNYQALHYIHQSKQNQTYSRPMATRFDFSICLDKTSRSKCLAASSRFKNSMEHSEPHLTADAILITPADASRQIQEIADVGAGFGLPV
jgi:hypothetical protein